MKPPENTTDALERLQPLLGVSSLNLLHTARHRLSRCLSVLRRVEHHIKKLQQDGRPTNRLTRKVTSFTLQLDSIRTTLDAYRKVKTAALAADYFQVPEFVFGRFRTHGPVAETVRKIQRSSARKTAAHDFRTRILYSAAENKQWFPFMVTLTAAPAHMDIFDNSDAWTDYYNRLRNLSAQALYPDKSPRELRKVRAEEHLVSFCVLERGTNGGRAHAHALIWLRWLPRAWRQDPCSHPKSTRRQVLNHAHLWPYGYSTCIAVRTGKRDPFSRHFGWYWPFEKGPRGTLQPIAASEPERLAGYLAKYLVKTSSQKGLKEWRNRINHNAGYRTLLRHLARHPQLSRQLAVNPQLLLNRLPKNWRLSGNALKRLALKSLKTGSTPDLVHQALKALLPSPLTRQQTSTRIRSMAENIGPTTTANSLPGDIDDQDRHNERHIEHSYLTHSGDLDRLVYGLREALPEMNDSNLSIERIT